MTKKFLLEKLRFMLCFLGLFSFFFIESSSAQLARKSTATSANGAEISAFDPATNRLFTVAGNAIEYYTLNSAGVLSSPTAIPYGLTLAAGTTAVPNSVAVKGGVLAFGFAIVGANNAQQPGKVAFYDPTTATYISDVTVGYLPDMIAFSPDGTKILTANEGEPNSYNQATSFDPEGSVSIIDISAGIASATVTEASFTSFNSQMATLKAAGVRIYGPNATVAQDLEPEYITFVDNATAAVTLQENNAVAMVDVATGTVTSINPLGLKDHSIAGNGFDASDRDLTSSTGKINIQNWPVKGMYMPDAIASFTSGGNTYFITANEGDSRAYTGYSEEIRVGATGATGYTLDPTVFPNATTLKLNANLGRLQLSNASGDIDGDGDFDEIHALGARSFSIWNSAFTQVFDSGDQLEQITKTQNAAGFNSDGTAATFDTRSDNKGPEPEGVTTGTVNGVPYAFVGSERTGDVFMYDITNPSAPVFKQYLNTAADTGVEGIIFVPADQSPTGNALVITSAETSRTVSVYEFTPPSVNLSVSTNTASETAGTVVTVTANASEPVFGDKTVSVDVTGLGITTADYTLSATTITIPSGASTGSVTYTVLNDNAVEALETAVVTISNPSAGIALGTTTTQNIAISDFVFTLQVLHASDFEAAVDAVQDAPRFAAIVDVLEDTYTNTIKLSSGDNYIPGPFLSSGEDSSLSAALKTSYESYYNTTFSSSAVNLLPSIGRADISILNFIGIEASALGNHEFDLGTTEVRNIIRGANSSSSVRSWFGAQFPYLSSNLNFSGDSNLSAIATTERLRLNTTFSSNPSESLSTITNKTKLAPSTIIMKGGQKIGIVGATTQVLASISSPGATTVVGGGANDMNILAGIIQPVVNSLIADGCNKIILLSHLQQIAFEKELAGKLKGVDIIVAGGSHALMADANDRLRTGDVAAESYPFLTTDQDGKALAIINTDGNYKYVGRLVVDFDADGTLIPSSINSQISGAYAADAQGLNDAWGANVANAYAVGSRGYQVKLLCDVIGNVINVKDGNLFGKTSVYLEGRRNFVRTQETNLGNVSAEANLWMAKFYDPTTVISIKNGGGLRSAIGNVIAVGDNVTYAPPIANPSASKLAGDISQLDIENSLRFNNQLSLMTLTATGLRAILEHAVNATTATATPGQFAQVAGVRYSYNLSNASGSKILNAVITDAAGNVIDTLVVNGVTQGDLTRTFRVVTLNFLAGGGDSYPFTSGTNRVDLNTLSEQGPAAASFTNAGSEQDAFAEYMKNQYSTTPYGIVETPLTQDCRIQRVPARADNVLPPNAGTNGIVTICNSSTVVTAAQLFAALGGTPVVGGTWSPALAGAGVYTYTVTSPSCSGSASATVTASVTNLLASATAGTISCFGGTTTVIVSATGGTAPYTGTGSFTANAGSYSYTVTDANGCTSIVTGTITQPTQLVASSTAGTIACFGRTTAVTVSATGGTAPYTGTGSFTVNAGSYIYTVTDANGCTATTSRTVTQPAQLTRATTLTRCTAYTWPVTGQTYATSGIYTGTTTNTAGCTVNETLNLTIDNLAFTAQPVSPTLCRAAMATTTVSVRATNVSFYQWYSQSATGTTWTPLANGANYTGVDSASLVITRTSTSVPATGTKYLVIIKNGCGSLCSETVSLQELTVLSKVAAITAKSASNATLAPALTTCSGTAVNLSLAAGSVGNIQWQISTASATTGFTNFGSVITQSALSANNSLMTISSGVLTQDTWFRVIASNGVCSSVTGSATKISVSAPAVAGTISGGNVTVCAFSANALNVSGTLSPFTNATALQLVGNTGTIVWQRSTNYNASTPIWSAAGSTTSTLNTTNLTVDTWYRAQVTSGACKVFTDVIKITVSKVAIAGVTTATSNGIATTSVCNGGDITFTSAAYTGTSIQWEVSTTSTIAGFQPVDGANGSSFTMFNVSYAPLSTFYVRSVVTSGACTIARSAVRTITVKPRPIAKSIVSNVTSPIGGVTTPLCTNDPKKVLTIGAGYTGAIQWQSSTVSTTAGFTNIDGATGASYIVTNPAVGVNYFRATFTNTCGDIVTNTPVAIYFTNCSAARVATNKEKVAIPFNVIAYPNPFSNNFKLSLESSSNKKVIVSVFDLSGKLIDQREVKSYEINSLDLGNNYPSGVYNVNVTQGTNVKTIRIVK